jgi:hypothetical protein
MEGALGKSSSCFYKGVLIWLISFEERDELWLLKEEDANRMKDGSREIQARSVEPGVPLSFHQPNPLLLDDNASPRVPKPID